MMLLLNAHTDPTLCLSKIEQKHPQTTHSYAPTNAHCCLTPVPGPTWPSAVYGWGVVVESWESADLPLIDDSVCGSLPVRALNLGWRESFGHKEGRASHAPVCCFWSSYTVMAERLAGTDAPSDATRAEQLTALLVLGWLATGGSDVKHSLVSLLPLTMCPFLYLYLFTILFLSVSFV